MVHCKKLFMQDRNIRTIIVYSQVVKVKEIPAVKKMYIFLLSLMFTAAMAAEHGRFCVLTCSPGDEAYSLFGHTGLRYCDKEKGMDIVFNYGYFDFDTPNFIWRFILGETDYMVGAVPYEAFEREYINRGSLVQGQWLELTREQEDALFEMLADNCRPENRVYRYNYFYNNCTTKIRDKVAAVVGNVSFEATTPSHTFREALNAMLAEHPWYAFGINILLGADIDRPATVHELQFIPDNFKESLRGAYVVEADSAKRQLVVWESATIPEEGASAGVRSNFTPFNASLLLLLFTLVIMLCEVRSRRTYCGFDVLLMLLQGASGLLLLFLALFSQHPAVGNNWLLLLLNPLALVVMPILVCNIRKHKRPYVAWVQVFFVVAFYASAVLGIQVYPSPLYFCAAALLARALFHLNKERICELSLH